MTEALPQSLKYVNQPTMPQANRIQHTLKAVNGSSFNPNDLVRFQIPCRKGLYLINDECYARITITNNTNNSFRLDGGVFSVLDRLQVFHGSNLLEDVQQYGALYSLLLDTTLSGDERNNCYKVMMGTEDKTSRLGTFTLTTAANVLTPSVTTNIDNLLTAGGGGANTASTLTFPVCGLDRRGDSIASAGVKTYCMPIISSIIGSHNPFWFPLSFCQNGGDLRVEFTLASNFSGVAHTNAAPTGNWVVSNFELVLTYCELNPTTEDQLRGLYYSVNNGEMLELVSKQYRAFRNTHTTATSATSLTHLIPARFQSLNQIFAIFRPTANLSSATGQSITSRNHFQLNQYQFRMGNGNLYPPTPVVGIASNAGLSQYLMELLKAIGSVGNLLQQTAISNYNYNIAEANSDGTFAIGVDLTTAGSVGENCLYQGADTRFSNIYLEATFGANTAANNITVDYLCNIDVKIVIVNGIASVVY